MHIANRPNIADYQSEVYPGTFTCPSTASVGNPVRLSSVNNSTVLIADASAYDRAAVFGFIFSKPTSTTCKVAKTYYFSGTSGFSGFSGYAGGPVYLTNTSGFSGGPGTLPKIVGESLSPVDALLKADPVSSMSSPLFAYRNKIINGSMTFNQRYATTTATIDSALGKYSLDHWGAKASGQSFTIARASATPPNGFFYYLRATVTSANTGGEQRIFQTIREKDTRDLKWTTSDGQPATLSFWIRSSVAGNIGGAINLFQQTGAYPFDIQVTAANTWQYKTVVVPPPAPGILTDISGNNNSGYSICFNLCAQSYNRKPAGVWVADTDQTYSPASAINLMATVSATLDITGVQFEKGIQATPFEFREYVNELRLCQQYYCKSFPIETVPATNTGTGGQNEVITLTKTGANTNYTPTINFPVLMECHPSTVTFTIYNPSADNNNVRDVSAGVDQSPSASYSDRGFNLVLGGHASSAIGNIAQFHWSMEQEFIQGGG